MENQEQPQDNASLSDSQVLLMPPGVQGGSGSNSRAFRVAGLTVLVCLLVSSQALMAYMIYNQGGQIHTLEKNTETIRKLANNPPRAVAPVQMHLPMNTMPLLMDFSEDGPQKTKTPLTKPENTVTVSLETQVGDLLQNFQLPQFNETFLVYLKSLMTQMEESEWKGLETWMRQWLIFQKAQQIPPPPTTSESAAAIQTKCLLEASAGRVRPGFYQPQCDELGHYKPIQCIHASGYCWCVDADGNKIPNTDTRGRPHCDEAPAPAARAIAAFPRMLQMKPLLNEE